MGPSSRGAAGSAGLAPRRRARRDGAARAPAPPPAPQTQPAPQDVATLLREVLTGAKEDRATRGLVQGARGFAERETFKAELRTRPRDFTQAFRELLAEETETTVPALQPAALRGFFERRVGFHGQPLLAHLARLLARFWELAEQGEGAQLQAAIAAGAGFLEQAALDEGRLEVAWLLTGLPPPTFLAAAPENQQQQRPGASLFPARWLAANLAYLRDLDYLAARTAAARRESPPDEDAADWDDTPAAHGDDNPRPRGPRNRGSRGRRGQRRSPDGSVLGD